MISNAMHMFYQGAIFDRKLSPASLSLKGIMAQVGHSKRLRLLQGPTPSLPVEKWESNVREMQILDSLYVHRHQDYLLNQARC